MPPPPSKTASRVRGRTLSTEDESEPRQSGRSSTGLAADSAAAALRNFARGRSSASKRSSATSSNSRDSFRSVGSGPRVRVDPANTRPQLPRCSTTPSPLTSFASSESLENLDNSSPGSSSEPGKNTDIRSAPVDDISRIYSMPPHRPIPPPPRRSRGRPRRHAESWQHGSMDISSSQTPMTWNELGRDYSRYPVPSWPSSFSTPSTPALQYSRNDGNFAARTPLHSPPSKEAPSDTMTQIGYTVDPEKRTSWLLDDRIGAPGTADAGYTFPLYLDEKELDDDIHMPQSDDDERLKPKLRDYFAPQQLCSLFGLLFMLVGLCCVFILLPVLSYSGTKIYTYPYHTEEPDGPAKNENQIEPWSQVNNVKYPLLQNIRTSLIDPDTPKSAMTRQSFLGEDLVLVFSDEFQTPNRTFYAGDDPFWTAPDFWYGATQDLEWYDPDAVTTSGGTLTLRMDAFMNHGLNYRSGMLNSWNQACFKGGALEISASLPGPGGASGLWPGAWTMGNLGRPGYRASTDGIWPYTYNSCDSGITPNQSMTDGTSYLFGQKLPSCTCPGEDHPTPGTGRGAPEIDVFEASADPKLQLGVITQSYQVAPYDIWYQPNYDFFAVPNDNFTQLNAYCGGPYQQAISGQTELNNKWYDGNLYQKYGFEYTPGTGSDAQISWFVGDDISFMMSGNAIGPNGNINSRPISEEPMSIVLNLGISPAWTGINFAELSFPTTMYVDYVRWYQPSGQTTVTCDPPGYETTEYIKNHPEAYNNINLTNWDETGYGWPKHKLNTKC